MKTRKKAIIIGAGPAGLTAAYELLHQSDILPVILEKSGEIGGISKTAVYKGNRIDIGGHRFFSKSDRITKWWLNIMPMQGAPARDYLALSRDLPLSSKADAPDPEKSDLVMLVRGRLSRIFYLRRFFSYPLTLSREILSGLGPVKVIRIGASYFRSWLFPVRNEKSLEDFFINRFGRELYRTFFRCYTEKVWGVPCSSIKPEWGVQRIKGLSVATTLVHAARKVLTGSRAVDPKHVETSLIEHFLYPKLGPGQLWEQVARLIVERGGEIRLHTEVVGIHLDGEMVEAVDAMDVKTGAVGRLSGDFFISTMPVRELIAGIKGAVPPEVRSIASGLVYRDFMTVGLLLKNLKIKNTTSQKTLNDIIPDNWIYIQEGDVNLVRLQIFNNWSPYMVASPDTVWVGLEYLCSEGDHLWNLPDVDFAEFAIGELAKIDLIEKDAVMDSVVIRMQKAYPAYFGSYGDFTRIREFTDSLANLFLIGRNGMHKYNNTDHSMMTAMVAVENILQGVCDKENIWAVNTEEEYHETRKP